MGNRKSRPPLYPVTVLDIPGQTPNTPWAVYTTNNKLYFVTVSPGQKLDPLPAKFSSVSASYNQNNGSMTIEAGLSNSTKAIFATANLCFFQTISNGQSLACAIPDNINQLLNTKSFIISSQQSNNGIFIILLFILILLILFLSIRN